MTLFNSNSVTCSYGIYPTGPHIWSLGFNVQGLEVHVTIHHLEQTQTSMIHHPQKPTFLFIILEDGQPMAVKTVFIFPPWSNNCPLMLTVFIASFAKLSTITRACWGKLLTQWPQRVNKNINSYKPHLFTSHMYYNKYHFLVFFHHSIYT